MAAALPVTHKPLYQRLYLQVLTAIVVGALLGHYFPAVGVSLKPLGDGFIKLIKMMIAPIVFATVTVGIAKMGHMSQVGRVGVKALLYFEVVSSVALLIGLVVVNVVKPGAGVNANIASLDPKDLEAIAGTAKPLGTVDFLLNIIPTSAVDAFAKGDILQVLLFSVLFGLAALSLGKSVAPLVALLDQTGKTLFAIVAIIMRLAPIGAFGAMAFTVGRYGVGSLLSLGQLMAGMYVTCLLFVFVVLGAIARAVGFGIVPFLKYISEEILIVLGTSSSESALPKIMEKLEQIGCPKPVVGLVVPTGYSFNLDGTSIYMTMAALFVAQASGVHLSLGQQLSLLGILLLTSKGAAAVTGSGFITLAATLSAFPNIPLAGLALLLGVDRFMSEARAITNLIGNAVATMVIARWEGALDMPRVRRILAHGVPELHDERLDTVKSA
jgi:aerobic C4-dicarboxylate transport protein